MIEAIHLDVVAEAICNAHCGDTDAWDITYDKGRDHYRKVAQAALQSLQIAEERELLHGPTFDALGDGISISSDGLTVQTHCHLCEVSFPPESPRVAFDTAYKHAVGVHDLTLHYRSRLASPWSAGLITQGRP